MFIEIRFYELIRAASFFFGMKEFNSKKPKRLYVCVSNDEEKLDFIALLLLSMLWPNNVVFFSSNLIHFLYIKCHSFKKLSILFDN